MRVFFLTPNKYRDFFWKAVKDAEETYTCAICEKVGGSVNELFK